MSRRLVGEGLGTALLLYVIVGSGIAAETLGSDPAVMLLAHAVIVGLGLGVLIALFQTTSGAHFNPSVTLGFWRTGTLRPSTGAAYVGAQLVGAIVGVVAANVSFEYDAVSIASTTRSGAGLLVAEFVGTFVLVLLILGLVRSERSSLIPAAVGAWVATIIFATSSTGFANPAVTVARMFTDTYTGIDPGSVALFVAVQLGAGLAAAQVSVALFPTTPRHRHEET